MCFTKSIKEKTKGKNAQVVKWNFFSRKSKQGKNAQDEETCVSVQDDNIFILNKSPTWRQ